jgi:hypothetical protein
LDWNLRPTWAQGRAHEITDREERLAAIAREYLKQPDRTLIMSPDNRSRLTGDPAGSGQIPEAK